ncbi:hypothetical protein [Paenibacillus agri]|uniref:DUF4190 domain-containing protein n=1 Tax=Paenibacillus agri TaxID=2744309 RepID=A0A850ERG3_9BACL|nr:hypothetical protein [Paenibacillus agri]NUU62380.1 hypothetical protein [Paenibacillus agri]
MDNYDNEPERSEETSDRKKVILRPRRVDYPRREREHREEYAAEVSPVPTQLQNATVKDRTEDDEVDGTDSGSRVMGYTGLAFGILSLFIWSIVLGPAAAVIGYFAYARGQKTTGAWAIGLGIVAALSYFVMTPFAR